MCDKFASCTVFDGFLFKIRTHEQLRKGIQLRARRLGVEHALLDAIFAIEKSHHFEYYDSAFSLLELSSGPYHIPRAKNMAAIDSFYLPQILRLSMSKAIETGDQQLLLF